ncbi:MAG: secretin N-terminal domain-containing protein, partial [Verrucomicrobiota bacterium]
MKTFLARTSAGFLAALVVASPLAARQNDPAPVPAKPQAVSKALPPGDPAASPSPSTAATPIAAPAKPVSDPAARLPAIPGAFPRRPATEVTAAATNVSATPAFPQLPAANPPTGNATTPTVVRTRPAPPAPPVPGGAPSAAAGTSAASAVTSAASGSDTASGDDATDVIDFKKMPLDQFLDQYAAEARRSVLRGQGLPQASIDFKAMTPLNHDERLQMFDTILALNGVTMIPTGEKAVLAVPTAQAMQEGGAFSRTTNSTDYAEASQFVTHVVQLKHVTVEEAAETVRQFAKNQNGIIGLPSTKTLVIRDYAINVKRMLEILAKIDVETPQDYELEVIPIKYGRVEDIYATMSSVIGGGGGGAGGLGASG